jgi:hypothetical protein
MMEDQLKQIRHKLKENTFDQTQFEIDSLSMETE